MKQSELKELVRGQVKDFYKNLLEETWESVEQTDITAREFYILLALKFNVKKILLKDIRPLKKYDLNLEDYL